jgi:hypothetical protein
VRESRHHQASPNAYEKGAGRVAKNLADALKRAKSQGDISVTDVTSVANHFVGMMRGDEYLGVILDLRGKIVGREADALVKSAVDLCVYGIAVRNEARRAHKCSR